MQPDETTETPNSQTESSEGVSESEVAKKCLDVVETYRRSEHKSSDKAVATRDLVAALSASTPELSDPEFNDSLGSYLTMLEQHDRAILDARGASGLEEAEAEENVNQGAKRPASPGTQNETNKKSKQDDTEFPWTIRERLTDFQLGDSLGSTLKLLRIFAKDIKFAKSSVINSPGAPPFPHSEWSNIILGSMVDLDHVISGSFAVTNDNREVELLGGMEVKFGASKPVKQVKTSGDWFIAWGSYTRAAAYVFPHRREEFDTYGSRILSLFAATTPTSHASVINLDKGIRARVGECRNLLLTDQASFEDLKLYWLNPIGAGGQTSTEYPRRTGQGKKPDFRDDEPCLKWNAGECSRKASECRHRHICELCRKNHRRTEHKSKQGDA